MQLRKEPKMGLRKARSIDIDLEELNEILKSPSGKIIPKVAAVETAMTKRFVTELLKKYESE